MKDDELPSVSIILAARNEEKVILPCINSLVNLDYPYEKLQIILVNDRSEDKTGEIMKSFQDVYKFVRYVEIVTESETMKGKTNALAQAIKHANGEIILTTDADIQVKSSWAKEMVKYYSDDTGIVSSYSVIEPKHMCQGIQSADWLYLLTIACASFGLSSPISNVGNNMSYRRKAYNESGGYESLKFSVTEDFLLLQAISKKTGWKAKFPMDRDVVNLTLPCYSIKELYNQKKRWAKGGLDSVSAGLIVGTFSWIMSAVLLLGWIVFSFQSYLIFLIVKLLLDIFLILIPAVKFKMIKAFLYFIPFQVYFAVYVFFMPFILLLDGKISWKNRKF
jgi:cellulose synthase/poly-beta-1,6-N-acetylglucosamine synthase-like glycosyltransferase